MPIQGARFNGAYRIMRDGDSHVECSAAGRDRQRICHAKNERLELAGDDLCVRGDCHQLGDHAAICPSTPLQTLPHAPLHHLIAQLLVERASSGIELVHAELKFVKLEVGAYDALLAITDELWEA